MLAHCSGHLVQSKPFCGGKCWGFFPLVVCLLEVENLEFSSFSEFLKTIPMARRSLKFVVTTLIVLISVSPFVSCCMGTKGKVR